MCDHHEIESKVVIPAGGCDECGQDACKCPSHGDGGYSIVKPGSNANINPSNEICVRLIDETAPTGVPFSEVWLLVYQTPPNPPPPRHPANAVRAFQGPAPTSWYHDHVPHAEAGENTLVIWRVYFQSMPMGGSMKMEYPLSFSFTGTMAELNDCGFAGFRGDKVDEPPVA